MVSSEARFRETFLHLKRPVEHGVIALSGGADSVVLTWLLSRNRDLLAPGCPLEAVYVHHGLSAHADQWAEFCRNFAQSLGIGFTCMRVKLENISGVGIEAAARAARYQALASCLKGPGSVLFAAHHANDQAETMLLALKRGAGPAGLKAMTPVRDFASGRLIRPLLAVSRLEIEEIARRNGLSYVTDESNGDDRYDRNFLRHHIVPRLQERFPGFLENVRLSAGYLAEADELASEIGSEDQIRCRWDGGRIEISRLLELSPARASNVVRLCWRQTTGSMPSRSLVESVFGEILPARADAAPRFAEGGFSVRRFRDGLYLVRDDDLCHPREMEVAEGCVFHLQGRGWILARHDGPGFAARPERLSFAVPYSTELHPYSRSKGRSIKKLFAEMNIPVWLRPATPVVLAQDRIVGLFPALAERDCYVQSGGWIFRKVSASEGD